MSKEIIESLKDRQRLIELINSEDEETALKACKEILDRAGDKPPTNINISEE